MRNIYLFLFYCVFFFPLRSAVFLNITDFGAVGDGATFNTTAIQSAIDSCTRAGGGEVIVPAGTFKTSTIILKSNVTLRIVPGAILKAPALINKYPEIPYNQPSWSDTYTKRSLIFAEEASNIRITGGGTIQFEGQYVSWVLQESDTKMRPFGIRMHKCTGIVIDSVHLETAPQWMMHLQRSDSIQIRDITIFNYGLGANDGMDIDACRHVLIERCTVDTNDDPIVIKSHSEDESSDILVRQCTVGTFERAVKVGNESLGAFKRIRFEDITVKAPYFPTVILPQTAIYLAVTDGGSADSIAFERITVQTPFETPIFIRLSDRGNSYLPGSPHPPVQFLRNVLLKDITCEAASTIPCSITGIPGYKPENILLKNISLTLPGGGSATVVPIPELENDRPENDIWGETLPACGFYVRHVNNLSFDSVCYTMKKPDPRPKYVMEDTTDILVVNDCDVSTGLGNHFTPELATDITAYPNPAGDVLYLASARNEQPEKLSLFDAAGKFYPVSKWWQAGSNRLQIAGLAPGMYWLLFEDSRGQQKMLRFVKQ